jgi:hypothetical protein
MSTFLICFYPKLTDIVGEIGCQPIPGRDVCWMTGDAVPRKRSYGAIGFAITFGNTIKGRRLTPKAGRSVPRV